MISGKKPDLDKKISDEKLDLDENKRPQTLPNPFGGHHYAPLPVVTEEGLSDLQARLPPAAFLQDSISSVFHLNSSAISIGEDTKTRGGGPINNIKRFMSGSVAATDSSSTSLSSSSSSSSASVSISAPVSGVTSVTNSSSISLPVISPSSVVSEMDSNFTFSQASSSISGVDSSSTLPQASSVISKLDKWFWAVLSANSDTTLNDSLIYPQSFSRLTSQQMLTTFILNHNITDRYVYTLRVSSSREGVLSVDYRSKNSLMNSKQFMLLSDGWEGGEFDIYFLPEEEAVKKLFGPTICHTNVELFKIKKKKVASRVMVTDQLPLIEFQRLIRAVHLSLSFLTSAVFVFPYCEQRVVEYKGKIAPTSKVEKVLPNVFSLHYLPLPEPVVLSSGNVNSARFFTLNSQSSLSSGSSCSTTSLATVILPNTKTASVTTDSNSISSSQTNSSSAATNSSYPSFGLFSFNSRSSSSSSFSHNHPEKKESLQTIEEMRQQINLLLTKRCLRTR